MPKVNVRKISKKSVKGYSYVRPNPGVRAIAAINGRGSYRKRESARSEMSGLSPAKRRARAKSAVRNATRSKSMPRRRIVRRNARGKRVYAGRNKVSFTVPRARGRGKRRISFRAPSGHKKGTKYTVMAKNRRRRVTRRRRRPTARRRVRVVSNRRRTVRRNRRRPAARRKTAVRRRRPAARRRKVVRRNRRRTTARRRPVRRNRRRTTARRRPVRRNRRRSTARRRPVRRNRRKTYKKRSYARRRPMRRNRRRTSMRRRYRRNATGKVMQWVRTGGFIAAGVIGHKFLTGFLKNLLVAKAPTPEALPEVDAQADGVAPAAGLGFLPAALVPYAGTISGGLAAAAGVYLVSKTVKNAETRKLVAGGMVASFLHTLIVDLLKKNAPGFAQQVSGLGASDANAARLSAMFGVGGATSIEPMFQPINGMGEYFSSGVNGLGSPEYAAAGMGEYFSSGINGVGEYFSSGVQGLGEYGANPDIMQAAAGYGALESGNSNHIDPGSNLDHALSIAEAAAGVGSLGPMQAAAGLGADVSTVPSSQTWIPGESDAPIWAGIRPVDRSQEMTAMIPAGTLQSGGGQGIFG